MSANMVTGGNVGKVNDIANQIRSTCMGIMEDTRAVTRLTEARDALSGGLQNQRLVIAREIARISSAGKWTDSDIKNAAKRAVKGAGNDGPKDSADKTLATFISEVKLFALPKIREQANVIIDACQEAWDVESALLEATKAADRGELHTPLHKLTKRLYHLTLSVTRAVKDGEWNVETSDDVIAYAEYHDPDVDHERVAKRLESMLSALQDIVRDFGNKDVALAAEYLAEVTADDLMKSRVVMREAERAEQAAQTETTIGVTINPTTVVNNTTPEIAEGVASIDDLLNDTPVAHLAEAAD